MAAPPKPRADSCPGLEAADVRRPWLATKQYRPETSSADLPKCKLPPEISRPAPCAIKSSETLERCSALDLRSPFFVVRTSPSLPVVWGSRQTGGKVSEGALDSAYVSWD